MTRHLTQNQEVDDGMRKGYQTEEGTLCFQEQEAGTVTLPSGKRLEVIVHSRSGFTKTEAEKHETAIQMLEEILNSVEFKQRFVAKKFTTTKKTSEAVYRHIMTGAESIGKDTDYEVDIWVEMYHEDNNVVGYTYGSTTKTWVNKKFFSKYDYAGVACNAFHEWLHKLGYDHSSGKDHSSVPYAGGYLVEDMIGEMIKGKKFTPIHSVETVVKPEPSPAPPTQPDSPEQPSIPLPGTVKKTLVCRRLWYTLWLVKSCRYE